MISPGYKKGFCFYVIIIRNPIKEWRERESESEKEKQSDVDSDLIWRC